MIRKIGLNSVLVTLLVAVLSWVGAFVVPKLDKSIVTRCQEGAEEGPKPVDPMVVWEVPVNDTGPERSGWVEGAAGKVHTCLSTLVVTKPGGKIQDEIYTSEFGDKQGQADADWRQKGCFGLLGRQHQHGNEQLGGQEHFDEQALSDRGAVAEDGVNCKRSWE